MSPSTSLAISGRSPFAWRPSTRFALASLLGAALVLTPLLALVATALSSSQAVEIWPHLAANVLPTALVQTALLLGGVGVVSAVLGIGTA